MRSFRIIRISIVYILILVLILPLLLLAFWTFAEGWAWPYLLPESLTLEGWRYFVDSTNGGWQALKNSFIIGIGVTILAMMISIPAGKALGLYQFPGKDLIKILVLAPIIVPPMALTMGIHINFMRLGLSDQIWGVIIVHLIPTLPYSIRILTHVFEAVGDKFEEQAQVLGARGWQRFIYITFPMIAPGIFSASILVFIISFSQYFLTFLIGGGQVITFPMVLFPLVKSGDRMLAAVYSWVFIAAVLIFTIIMEQMFRGEEIRNDHFYI